jgi:uncharacterized membrane protein
MHQVLQWHHVLSDEGDFPTTTVEGLEGNTLADGIFHLGTWAAVAAAMVVTMDAWQRGRLAPPWSTHLGMVLVGFGSFNLVEGLIDHQLLGLHHVRDDLGGPLSWDLGYLLSGVLLLAVGAALVRAGRRRGGARARSREARADRAG